MFIRRQSEEPKILERQKHRRIIHYNEEQAKKTPIKQIWRENTLKSNKENINKKQ